jgi:hypothetical protein
MTILSSQLKKLQAFPSYAKTLILRAEGDELIDILAEINSVEQQLGKLRRSHQAELVNNEGGDEWEVKTSRSATRSYNNPRLILKAAEALKAKPLKAMAMLVAADVLKLNWQWKKLQQFVAENDITIQIAQHEISEGDEADVGEVWTTSSVRYAKKT